MSSSPRVQVKLARALEASLGVARAPAEVVMQSSLGVAMAVAVAVPVAVAAEVVVQSSLGEATAPAGEVTGEVTSAPGEVTVEEKPTGRLGIHPLRKGCLQDAH